MDLSKEVHTVWGKRAGALAMALTLWAGAPCAARAEVVGVPPAADLPSTLTLDEALQMFRLRGFDLLIAEAQVGSAVGDEQIAGAIQNPSVNVGYGHTLGYDASQATNPNGRPCAGCSANQYTIGISDSAAIENSLSGKRSLRLHVAHAALAAAKLARADAQRVLEFQVKQQYLQVVQAQKAHAFALEVQESYRQSLELNQKRYTAGAIDDGVLARVETAELEADQAVDSVILSLRQARIALAFLLGARGRIPDFGVEKDLLNFSVPAQLGSASATTLVHEAFERRPDLRVAGYQRQRAEGAIELAKRQAFPDISLSAQYTQTGTGQAAIQPPTLSFGISAPVPILYRNQGEIRKAEADFSVQSLQQAKVQAQIVADVEAAFAAFVTSRQLVVRMEGGLIDRATTARNITKLQFEKGTATLIDSLDAQRTLTATKLEYLQDLTSYWTAVAQLERAVGMDLRR